MPGKNDNKSFQLKKGDVGEKRYKVLKFYEQLSVEIEYWYCKINAFLKYL